MAVLTAASTLASGEALKSGTALPAAPPPQQLSKLSGLLAAVNAMHAAVAQNAHADELLACRNVRALAACEPQGSAPSTAVQVRECCLVSPSTRSPRIPRL